MAPINIDLYKDDLAVAGDRELYAAVESFIGAELPRTNRTHEGYMMDFKADWSDSALKTVAAFANTFGGLLFIGITENSGRAEAIVGVHSARQELKTRIASTIGSNISPTPPYEIRDISFPDGSDRHLYVVRVRKGNHLYLLTKKGEQPVYIRNMDESRPADAAQLQALLATRVQGPPSANPFASPHYMATHHLYVTQQQHGAAPGERVRSPTFLQIHLMPEEPLRIRLELKIEEKIISLIRASYPQLAENVDDRDRGIGASFTDIRLSDWYQVTYAEIRRDYEIQWAIDSTGAVYFVTQVRCKVQMQNAQAEVWSLCDVMTNLECTIEFAHQIWNYLNYLGEARVLSELRVESLPLLEKAGGSQAAYLSAFYEESGPRHRSKPLLADALVKAANQRSSRAMAAVNLTYTNRNGSRAEIVAILANQFLRDLGYGSNLADLRSLLI